jgi:peptidoglycan/LPS O-acetylase OafA/YrhL
MRLSEVADSRDNNFDVLRLFAAAIVLVSHSFFLAGVEDPVGTATGITLGSLGVALFFGMSGYHILKTWSYDPKVLSYARKRALRIMPALWVALLLTTLVLGPLVTELSLGAYLADPGTWRYLLLGSALLTFGGVLPGVFADNPYPDAVNGSLWTLPIEASAYVMVAVLGVVGVLRHRISVPLLLVAALTVSWAVQENDVLLNLRLYAFFLMGMTLYAWRDRIVLSWPLALIGLMAWVVSFNSSVLVVVSATALPYAAMVVAYRTPHALRRLVHFGDVSYGLYIYAFPVQQLVAWSIGDDVTPLQIFAVSLPIAWLCGLASWRLVERPALRLKPRAAAAPRPEVVAGAEPIISRPAVEAEPATSGS